MSRRSSRSPSSSFAARLVCAAAALALVAGGCTRTRVEMVAKYRPGAPSRIARTPDVGVYKIKYVAGPAGEELHTLRGSKRFLGKGQPVGFVLGDEGQIIAVAGEERFPARLPDDARFCVWHTKTEVPSDFGRGVGDVAHHLGVGVGVGLGVIGGLVVLGAVASLDDDCRHGRDRDRCRDCRY